MNENQIDLGGAVLLVTLFILSVLAFWFSSQDNELSNRVSSLEKENASLASQIDFLGKQRETDSSKVEILLQQVEDFQGQEFETRLNTQSSLDSLKTDLLVLREHVDNGGYADREGGLVINQYQFVDSNNG